MLLYKLFIVESKKLLSHKAIILLPFIYFFFISLFMLLLSNGFNIKFLDTYFRWLNISNDKDVFQFLIGKTRLINAFLMGLLILISNYYVFTTEYNYGTINYLNNQKIKYLKILSSKILVLSIYFFLFFSIYLIITYLIRFFLIYKNPIVIRYDVSTNFYKNLIYILFFFLFSVRNALLLGVLSQYLSLKKSYSLILYAFFFIYFSFKKNSFFTNTYFNQIDFSDSILLQSSYCLILLIIIYIVYRTPNYGMAKN